jgi:acid phosphatase family membrane protein YuiD
MAQYKYLIALCLSWVIAQAIKLATNYRKNHTTTLLDGLFHSGGMPSSHTSFMMSLVTLLALDQGINSATFAIMVAVTAIVAYDSVMVRRTVGDYSDAIKEVIKNSKNLKSEIHYTKGHSLIEVIAGAILGIVVGVAVYYIF